MNNEEAITDYERERGKPPPTLFHGLAQTNLIRVLWPYQPQYTLLPELDLDLDGLFLTPDFCIYPGLRIDLNHDVLRMTEPPLVAIWIENSTEPLQKMQERIQSMLAAGVQSCWLVQPAIRAVTVFASDRSFTTITEGVITDPATGIEVALSDIFPGS